MSGTLLADLRAEPCPTEHVEVEAVQKDMSLNAVIVRFPDAHGVLRRFRLNQRWFGSDTVEEVAWYHGLSVENLLAELNRSIGAAP